jgi:TetR/AcrR family transcriptional regulator
MGTAERRQREKEQREREIVGAARELFFRKGYDATSVDEIAAMLEISKGKVYLYFTGKDELYYAVAREGLTILRDMFVKATGKERTGLERLMAIGQAYIEFWTAQPEYRRLFHSTTVRTPAPESGPQGRAFLVMAGEMNVLMVKAIEAGMEDGSIRADMEPQKLAFCASSMVEGILERMERSERSGGSTMTREDALSYAFELMRVAITCSTS